MILKTSFTASGVPKSGQSLNYVGAIYFRVHQPLWNRAETWNRLVKNDCRRYRSVTAMLTD